MVKIVKKLKYYYEVSFKDEVYNIEKEVIYKYQIKDNKAFTQEQFDKILKDNDYYYFDRFSKNKLRKMLTTYELKQLLLNAGASEILVADLIKKYQTFHYLDDENYIKMYIEFKSSKHGPKYIKKTLLEKGLDENLIDKYLSKVNEEEIINNLIESLLKRYKNNNKQQLKQKIIKNLMTKGFNITLVQTLTNNALNNVAIDELPLLEKEYYKLLNKYQVKMSSYELEQTLKQKLYSKGFNMSDINKIIDKNSKK